MSAQPSEPEGGGAPVTGRRLRAVRGDVHVASIAADVPPVPGSATEAGAQRIAALAADVLERVRRSIRRRSPS